MTYTQRHKLLTMHGTLWSGSQQEEWNAGFRIIPPNLTGGEQVTQAHADAAFAICKTWFTSTAANMPSVHSLQWVKLAPIGTDGKYPTGEDSVVSTGTAGFGSNSTSNHYPSQCTLAVSLMTQAPRGLAWTGRFYTPCPSYPLGTDGRIAAGNITSFLGGLKTMLDGINAISGLGLIYVMSKGTVKNPGAASRRVISIRVGQVIDTQRRRRNKLLETYGSTTLA